MSQNGEEFYVKERKCRYFLHPCFVGGGALEHIHRMKKGGVSENERPVQTR
jgi:hypothetical protein